MTELALPRRVKSRPIRVSLAITAALLLLSAWGLVLEAPPPLDCCAEGPSLAHPLGLDARGRDLMVLVLRALATSVMIVLASSTLAVTFGALYGATMAGLPADVRAVGMRTVDVVAATPITLIVITLMVAMRTARDALPSALGPLFDSRFVLVFCVASLQWLSLARVVFARVLALSQQPFIQAARIVGLSRVAILRHHVIPHARGPLLVFGLLALPSGLVAEGFFSFLGFGVEEPYVSLGTLIAAGLRSIVVAPLAFFAPALVLVTATAALQLLGATLRDELRPEGSRRERGMG